MHWWVFEGKLGMNDDAGIDSNRLELNDGQESIGNLLREALHAREWIYALHDSGKALIDSLDKN